MAFDYASEIVPVAIELLEEFGRPVTFIELGDVAANASQPWLGATSPRGAPKQTLVLNAAFVEPESMERLGNDATTDDFHKRSQQICIVHAAVELAPFDEILDTDGSRWKITGISKLKAGPTLLVYFVGTKR